MAKRTILAVNTWVPHDDVEYVHATADQSLLDADVILFTPTIPDRTSFESYNGKPCLTDDTSVRSRDAISHWRSELSTALQAGKTVVVYLAKPQEVYAYTGEQTFSGTGRSRVTTNIVQPLRSYAALPIDSSSITPKGGSAIRPARDLGILATYWAQFGAASSYECYFDKPIGETLLTTKTGNKMVGGIVSLGAGLLVLLPKLTTDDDAFVADDEEGEEVYTSEGIRFGSQLLQAIVSIDKAARSGRERTPAPEWVGQAQYTLASEIAINQEISRVSAKIERLTQERARLRADLQDAQRLKDLLFERGAPLETAVRESLAILGFAVEHVVESGSEFDALITAAEGRFLVEVEGTDGRAINIDKLAQLERNIQEDFERDAVSEYAKGILIGNPQRLISPTDRTATFTDKCLAGAKRSGIALLLTTDLYVAAKYVMETDNDDFAQRCRESLVAHAGGVVQLPTVPETQIHIAESEA